MGSLSFFLFLLVCMSACVCHQLLQHFVLQRLCLYVSKDSVGIPAVSVWESDRLMCMFACLVRVEGLLINKEERRFRLQLKSD